MDVSLIVASLGTGALWLVLGTVLGMVIATGVGVGWLRGRAISPALAVAAVGLPAAAGMLSAVVRLHDHSAPVAEAIAGALGLWLVTPLFVLAPALVLALFGAALGVSSQRRRWGRAMLGVVATATVVALTVIGGVVQEDLLYPAIRAAIYAVVGGLAALALLRDDDTSETVGVAPAAALGVVLALVVTTLEASGAALERTFLFAHLGDGSAAVRVEIVRVGWEDIIGAANTWHFLSGGAAMVAALVMMGATRRVSSAVAVIWLMLVPLAWGVTSHGDFVRLARAPDASTGSTPEQNDGTPPPSALPDP